MKLCKKVKSARRVSGFFLRAFNLFLMMHFWRETLLYTVEQILISFFNLLTKKNLSNLGFLIDHCFSNIIYIWGLLALFLKTNFFIKLNAVYLRKCIMCVFRARPNREKPSFLNKEGAGGPKSKVIFVESILAQSQTIIS